MLWVSSVLRMRGTGASRLFASAGEAAAATGSSNSNKVLVSLRCPERTVLLEAKADLVTIPGSAGVFGVGPNHVPLLEQLQPGVLTIQNDAVTSSYFVAGGFAFIKEGSICEISTPEVAPVSDIDLEAVRKLLAQAKDRVNSAQNDQDRVTAQVAVEVFEAMQTAAQ